MKKITIGILLAFAWLTLRADSCVLSSRNVEVPLRGDADLDFTTQGASDSKTFVVDFLDILIDLEADEEIDELVSASIENGYWRLVENRGDPATTVTGSITIQRVSSGQSAPLVAPETVVIEEVGSEFDVVPLQAAGVDLLTAGFDEYVAARNGGGPFPDLDYVFTWNSNGGPSPVDFDWQGRLKFTIVGVFEVEVPDLWD